MEERVRIQPDWLGKDAGVPDPLTGKSLQNQMGSDGRSGRHYPLSHSRAGRPNFRSAATVNRWDLSVQLRTANRRKEFRQGGGERAAHEHIGLHSGKAALTHARIGPIGCFRAENIGHRRGRHAVRTGVSGNC